MSLLADLLSKVKHRGFKSDVPPNLKHAVLTSSERYAAKKKIIFLSILVFAAVASGVGAVYIINFYGKLYETKKIAQQVKKSPEQVIGAGPFIPAPAVNPPGNIAYGPAKKPAGSGSGIKKSKVKKKAASRAVKPPQKDIQEEKSAASESEISGLAGMSGDKKKLSDEDLSKRDAYILAAQTHESGRDYHSALLNYKKALGLDPENHAILNNIASALLRLDSYNEAAQYLKNALNIEKDYVPSLINLGIANAMLGNFQEGESYLTRALAIEPSNGNAVLNAAILYERQGDNDKAYGFFNKLSQMGNIQGYLGIARIAEKQGRLRDALQTYMEIAAMNGIDPGLRRLAKERLLNLQKICK
ncbi:MAG: tetratricopeptide repeat protein [Nitrospirae bacterium]|nr:MAG: tetratricopeptide repeat protein [Nitrospirota bacterium]